MMRKFGMLARVRAGVRRPRRGLWRPRNGGPSSLPQGPTTSSSPSASNESATAGVTGFQIRSRSTTLVVLNPEAGSGSQVHRQGRAAQADHHDDGTFTSTHQDDWSGGSIPVGQFGEFDVSHRASRRDVPTASRRSRRTPTGRSCRG